jgi:hypothetical protein
MGKEGMEGRKVKRAQAQGKEYSPLSFLYFLYPLSTTPLPPFGKGECQLIFEKI